MGAAPSATGAAVDLAGEVQWLGEVSTGPLYHHLGALAAAHLIGKGGRNNYRIAAPAVVPTLS